MHASQKGWGQVEIHPSDWHPDPWVEGCSSWTGSRSLLFIMILFKMIYAKIYRATMHHANRVWAFLIPSVSPLEFKSILFFESMTIMTTTEDR